MRQNIRSSSSQNARVSATLILSYVFDWVIILTAAMFGAWFAHMPPNKRPFALENPEISFPFQNHEKVPTMMLAVYAMAIPAIVVLAVCIFLVPGPTVSKSIPKNVIWARKLWEWHTGWLGLFLSLSAAFLITSGMKNLFGKPRPDLLARCDPDLADLQKYKVGGFFGTDVVSAAICRQTNMDILNDGFRSYPSGHSSFAAGGLIYLSLFLASKLAITIPYLSSSPSSISKERYTAFPTYLKSYNRNLPIAMDRKSGSTNSFEQSGHNEAIIGARNEAAAPPVYLLVFAIIPFFTSIYISSTRYSDFRHHGFDILFGYLIGAVSAIFSFRWYHLPISQGAGWSWGPRSRDRSFWAGVGVGNYAGLKDEEIEEPEMGLNSGRMENVNATRVTRTRSHDSIELLSVRSPFNNTEPDLHPSKNL
ncbi:unnamed protein product [Blumeria hordei]|uniref:Phosphatidic acid phosphatase type 2/haloperoxidase domain-containing protein n=1 Tax=Blumeria hordei TaxID=2867405 RepID=A0A383UK17_BLUHO|nr:unnamed protein product [Blumeria hordei]